MSESEDVVVDGDLGVKFVFTRVGCDESDCAFWG